jgi:osmoprotectant transport system substrate-binding protein
MNASTKSSQITRRGLFPAACAAGLLGANGAAGPARGAPRDITAIVVASKIDTEGALLGSLIAAALRAHGLPVQTRLQLGPTSICRAALMAGEIDIYPEYTGNGAAFFRSEGEPAWHDAGAAWALVRRLDAGNGIIWLAAAPADNGWGIAVRDELKEALGGACLGGIGAVRRFLSPSHHPPHQSPRQSPGQSPRQSLASLSCYLQNRGRLLLAASVEFVESPDALPAFERSYGFRLRQDQLIALAGGNTAATLRAAAEGLSGINAAMAYSTDGALAALRLTLLDDPHHAQIVFQPAPVVRAPVLAANPQIAPILAPVFATLTVERLRGLNAQVSVDGRDPAQVAARYLAELS